MPKNGKACRYCRRSETSSGAGKTYVAHGTSIHIMRDLWHSRADAAEDVRAYVLQPLFAPSRPVDEPLMITVQVAAAQDAVLHFTSNATVWVARQQLAIATISQHSPSRFRRRHGGAQEDDDADQDEEHDGVASSGRHRSRTIAVINSIDRFGSAAKLAWWLCFLM